MYKVLEDLEKTKNINEFISDRLTVLKSPEYQSSREHFGNFVRGYSSGFFAENEKVEFGTLEYGYYMDDDSVYETLANNLLSLKQKHPDKPMSALMGSAVNKVVREYFQADKTDYPKYIENLYNLFKDDPQWKVQLDYVRQIYKDTKTEQEILKLIELQAREWFPVFAEKNNLSASVKTIKGLGIAKCAEYAALTNQLFNFLGVECFFVANSLADKNGTEGHAYNLIITEKGFFIYDSITLNKYLRNVP